MFAPYMPPALSCFPNPEFADAVDFAEPDPGEVCSKCRCVAPFYFDDEEQQLMSECCGVLSLAPTTPVSTKALS